VSKQNNWTPEPWADAADLPSDAQARNPMIYFGVVVMGQSNYRRAKTCVSACTGMSDPDKEIKAMREVVEACEKLRSEWTPQHVATTALDFAVVDVILALAALKAEGEGKNGYRLGRNPGDNVLDAWATDASGALSRAGGKQ